METSIKAEVVKDKSFDPHFLVRVSYDDGINKFKNETVSVLRKPPRIGIDYPESVQKILERIDEKQLELEIMKAIVENLLNSPGRF